MNCFELLYIDQFLFGMPYHNFIVIYPIRSDPFRCYRNKKTAAYFASCHVDCNLFTTYRKLQSPVMDSTYWIKYGPRIFSMVQTSLLKLGYISMLVLDFPQFYSILNPIHFWQRRVLVYRFSFFKYFTNRICCAVFEARTELRVENMAATKPLDKGKWQTESPVYNCNPFEFN